MDAFDSQINSALQKSETAAEEKKTQHHVVCRWDPSEFICRMRQDEKAFNNFLPLKFEDHYLKKELDRQVPHMDEIDDKVDRANSDLKNTNVRLKDTVNKDEAFDDIAEGLGTQKNMAHDLNEELDRQMPLMDEIDDKVDRANSDLKNTNVRLKDTVNKLRSSRNFVFDSILLCIILGIAAYLYNVLK